MITQVYITQVYITQVYYNGSAEGHEYPFL